MNNISKYLLILIFLSALPLMSEDKNQQELFEKANRYFKEKKYKKACNLYNAIDNKGFIVLYNMSLTYLYLQKYGQAMVCIKRAEKYANFTQLDMLFDLTCYIKKQADFDYVISWYEQISLLGKKCIVSIPAVALQIFLLLLLLFFIVVWYCSWYQIYKKMVLWTIFSFIIFAVLYCYQNYYMHRTIGFILQDTVNVLAGPDISFYTKAHLCKAEAVFVLEKQKNYYHIKTKDKNGWISDDSIELV